MRIPEERTENRSPRTLLARVVVTPTRSTSSCLPSPPPSPAFASSPDHGREEDRLHQGVRVHGLQEGASRIRTRAEFAPSIAVRGRRADRSGVANAPVERASSRVCARASAIENLRISPRARDGRARDERDRARDRRRVDRRLTMTRPNFRRAQAAVVAATTLAMSSPAFAATIKLGGDNGELGFYVRDPTRRDATRRDARATRRTPPSEPLDTVSARRPILTRGDPARVDDEDDERARRLTDARDFPMNSRRPSRSRLVKRLNSSTTRRSRTTSSSTKTTCRRASTSTPSRTKTT